MKHSISRNLIRCRWNNEQKKLVTKEYILCDSIYDEVHQQAKAIYAVISQNSGSVVKVGVMVNSDKVGTLEPLSGDYTQDSNRNSSGCTLEVFVLYRVFIMLQQKYFWKDKLRKRQTRRKKKKKETQVKKNPTISNRRIIKSDSVVCDKMVEGVTIVEFPHLHRLSLSSTTDQLILQVQHYSVCFF